MELSRKSQAITESLTFAISTKVKAMKAEGIDVIPFGIGEPDFDTPEYIVEAAKKALDEGLTRYTPASGIIELKEAVCKKFSRDNQLEYKPSQIIISTGAKQSLYNVFQALLNPGDEVIVPVPYWISYPEMVKMASGNPVFLEASETDDFKINVNKLEKQITPRTRALFLNTPGNPTGVTYQRDELQAIADLVVEKGILVISDEIYEKIIYDGIEHVSIASLGPEIKEQTIVINGMSKTYAMTGWRIGFAAADEELINVMSNIQGHSTSNPNSIAQYASVAGLNGGEEIIKTRVAKFDSRRKYIIDRVNKISRLSCIYPSGAFYIMINISEFIGRKYKGKNIEGSMSFASLLLENQKVGLLPGKAFGVDSFVRISYATSLENIKKGMDRIEAFVGEID